MQPTEIPVKNDQIVYQRPEQDGFLINPLKGNLLAINPTGAQVWELIDGQKNIADIIQEMSGLFNQTDQEIQKDLLIFLQKLKDRSLIYLKEE